MDSEIESTLEKTEQDEEGPKPKSEAERRTKSIDFDSRMAMEFEKAKE